MVDGVFNGRHFSPSGRSAAASLCSPLPTSPCGSVSGSKIFTFPPPDFSLSSDRQLPLFAPRSPRALVAPSRGAKSSHSRRRISPSQATGGLLSLLPTPREPLWLRFGEQNLHIPAGAFRLPQQPASHSNRKRVARASSGLPDAARPLISQFFISNVRKSNRHESAHMLFRPDSLPQCNPLYP